jgi:S1-C subfamily serine protease
VILIGKVSKTMSMDVSRDDLQRLVQIVKDLPVFDVDRDRRPFLITALGESPRAKIVVGSIDLGGAPEAAARKLIIALSKFGQLEYGKQALGVFLNAVLPYVDLGVGDEITDMFKRYPLDTPTTRRRPIDDWRAKDVANEIDKHEKIIGENTLFPIAILERALEAARAVLLVRVQLADGSRSWLGTGFLVARDLIMTNHHVIESPKQAKAATFTFNYQLGPDGTPCAVSVAQPAKGGLFWSDKMLDVAVVQVVGVDAAITPLKLSAKVPTLEDAVTLIGHPAGHLKQISLRNNAVQFADGRRIQYTASTEPGSSGSPLLDRSAEQVVGIHHSGGELVDPERGTLCFRNEGTTMRAVLADLRKKAPEIYSRV